MIKKNYVLPISYNNGLFLANNKAREIGENLADQYCFAKPYPHIVIDNFLPIKILENILIDFPKSKLNNDINHNNGVLEQKKRQILPYDCSEQIREAFIFFNSPAFLNFLEGITRIRNLIPDPYFTGGGLHEIYSGGQLGVHADFRIHEKLNLIRRLNVLIYLNKDWDELYGGHLEIWDQSMKKCVHKILPIMNRCVIFNTDEKSYHGHPNPLQTIDETTRKSIALYYYTSEGSIEDMPTYSTMFKSRPKEGANGIQAAFISRMKNYMSLRELLPPIMYRNIKKIYKKIKNE